jgi:hypothetical protein
LKDTWYKAVELLIEYRADPKIRCETQANRRFKTTARYKRDVVVENYSEFLVVPEILQRVFTLDKATRLKEKIAEVWAPKPWAVLKWFGWA